MLRGRLALSWGDVQERFYVEYYQHHDDEERPKFHSRVPFMKRLVQSMFRIFLGIWRQRNAILHDTISGTRHATNRTTIQRIYRFHYFYLAANDSFLLDMVPIDQLESLSPFATSQLLSTLLVSIRARHKDKTDRIISQDPNHTIERYFNSHPREGIT